MINILCGKDIESLNHMLNITLYYMSAVIV